MLKFIALPAAGLGFAATQSERMDLTSHPVGYVAIALFVLAYLLVMTEEYTDLRKSKPVIMAAGIIWAAIAGVYAYHGKQAEVTWAARHNLLEYAELMLFLLVAMTYINTMEERRIFEALENWLVRKGYSYRQLFWVTGLLAFFISPVADNLTTAMLMCAVVLAVGRDNTRFIAPACINIVVAANAGGAFSPFGDITTLMVWQRGVLGFGTFFKLFLPALVNFLVPAVAMHFAIPAIHPEPSKDIIPVRRGALRVVILFLLTVATAVVFHNFLGLPPVLGMLTGLGYLQVFGYYLRKTPTRPKRWGPKEDRDELERELQMGNIVPFDIFSRVARSEWDTLLFFYGVVLSVGGLGFLGYLALASDVLYHQWGPVPTNIMLGALSAVVDNIPVMFSVLSMQPDMDQGQWLLVTLTVGVGGSLLSVGSAAGVALMGQARGHYTFMRHLKWTPVIALGYLASVAVHMSLHALGL